MATKSRSLRFITTSFTVGGRRTCQAFKWSTVILYLLADLVAVLIRYKGLVDDILNFALRAYRAARAHTCMASVLKALLRKRRQPSSPQPHRTRRKRKRRDTKESDKIANFIEWCREAGLEIHPKARA